ncbi:carboxypeptidase regulatory-like domain-containing protein [Alloacidobacterium sp.]|uniref:carboxypeptidase regulatory-like domain-containing protein n=1 Tax=Alloacidobacterium sp. TaxID=2951999 RepID=UPI002D5BAD27|nr:carboxypeptidase regulatory-like domain-containing protein [Alloacidobacterium sp.]HYK36902.1 carboxypeptidase regulatory-like domain-containing protein [Alloacidobacterium sp.]
MITRICKALACGLGAALLAFIPLTSHAQAVYGSIYGTVTDNTGAVIPNATVTVTDEAKGTVVTVQSNESGAYTVDHLVPDSYDVKVSVSGFQNFEAKGIKVFADTAPKVDAQLTVGGASQTVTVNADAIPVLKTDRADVSTEFSTQTISDVPLPDRNFTNIQLLLPGAQPLGWGHAASENPQASKQIQVDGQAFGGVAFTLDGTDNQDPILGIIVINPPLDALSETKITTQNFDAEFGKAVSSFVSAQTKSGSNSFHGSAFDYRESNANLARDPYSQSSRDPVTGQFIPGGLKNQFGGSIGGPIIKDRLFFFGDYQGVRQKVGISQSATVPTPLLTQSCLGQRVGPSGIPGCDFSDYASATGIPQLIYDNSSGTSVPFPGNVIPTAKLSSQALALLTLLNQPQYYPNTSGNVGGTKNNYALSGTGLFNDDQWDERVDWQANSKTHVFERFSRFTDTLTGKTMFGDAGGTGFGLQGYGGTSKGANDSLAAGADIAISPSLLTDFRVGYYRYNIITSKYDQTTDFATALGIPGLNVGGATSGAPAFQIAESDTFGTGTANQGQNQGAQYGSGLNVNRCNCPLTEKEDQFQLVNNWTKIVGNHSIKFGADLRYARNLRVPSDSNRTGQLRFDPGPTSLNGASAGNGFATFVLGDVTNFSRYVSVSTNAKEFQKRFFFYGQDTWRVTPNLTLNLGLRYEFYFPESVNGKGNGALMNLKDGFLRVAGYGNIGTNMNWSLPSNAWNPRIGLAYQLDPNTVIRAGYGRSFDIGVFGSIFGHNVTQNIPVLANQSISSPTTTSYAFNLSTGPAAYVFPSVPSNGLLPSPGYAVNVKARPDGLRLPTLDAWNLSIQRAITPTLSATLAYVGNKGTHTLSAGDGNTTNPNEAGIFLPANYSINGQTLHYDPSVASGISANNGTSVSNFLSRYYGGTLAACQSPDYATPIGEPGIQPGMCGWTNGVSYYGDDQDTEFNSLQATLSKQFTRGLSFNANYAWQRGYNFNGGYATWDKSAVKGRDDAIREQQFILYGTYQLPFGRNQMFVGNANGIVNQIIGGWQFSPVLTWSSGLPFTLGVGGGCGASVPGSAPCYPNGSGLQVRHHLTGFNPVSHSRTYFTAADVPASRFPQAGLDQIGTMGRNSVYGPAFFNTDLSLQKNFPIHESLLAQFRVDAYNGFNYINAGNPGTTQTGSDGVITSEPALNVYTNPRQLQFSLRVQF